MSLYLLPMILVPNITHAYLHIKLEKNEFLRSGYKADLSKSVNTFAIYDNFTLSKIEKQQILFPKSKYFISADLISVAFPLPMVFYSHTTTENTLADLLYANLKLKKLIKEYEDIQERSKKMIWNSQYLFQQEDSLDSIYQINNKLKDSSSQIAKNSRLPANFRANVMMPNRSGSFRSSHDRNNLERTYFQASANRANGNWTAQNNSFASPQYGGEPVNKESISRKNSKKSYNDGSYPLILRLLAKLPEIIPYFIANKGEALFYGIGLYVMASFFILILRR